MSIISQTTSSHTHHHLVALQAQAQTPASGITNPSNGFLNGRPVSEGAGNNAARIQEARGPIKTILSALSNALKRLIDGIRSLFSSAKAEPSTQAGPPQQTPAMAEPTLTSQQQGLENAPRPPAIEEQLQNTAQPADPPRAPGRDSLLSQIQSVKLNSLKDRIANEVSAPPSPLAFQEVKAALKPASERIIAPPPPEPDTVLSQIRQGVTLKPANERVLAPAAPKPADIFSEIRAGVELKPVQGRTET